MLLLPTFTYCLAVAGWVQHPTKIRKKKTLLAVLAPCGNSLLLADHLMTCSTQRVGIRFRAWCSSYFVSFVEKCRN